MFSSRTDMIFCVFTSWIVIASGVGVTEIKVGVMLISDMTTPYTLERVEPAIQIAIDVVNSEILNSSYKLVPVLRTYDIECNARNGTGVASELFYKEHISALIGPGCSYALDDVARLAGFWNIPILTGVGDSGIFVEKENYPTLTRFAYCQCHARQVVTAIFEEFHWSEIVLLYDVSHPQTRIMGNSLRNGIQKENLHPHVITYNSAKQDSKDETIDFITRHSRVIILIVSGDVLREFLLEFYDRGLIQTGEYVFFDFLPFEFSGTYWGNHHWRRGDSRDHDAKMAYEALLRISLFQPSTETWKNFTDLVIRKANESYSFDFKGEQVNFFVGAFYEAVVRYGYLVNESLDSGLDIRDGYRISRIGWNKSFNGIMGNYKINSIGDRQTDFTILDMDPDTGEFQAVAHFFGSFPGYTPYLGRTIHWPGGRTEAPLNIPRCGFLGNLSICDDQTLPTYVKVILILMAAIIFMTVAVVIFCRQRRWEKELSAMSWRIKLQDVHFQGQIMGSRLSNQSMNWLNEDQMSKSGCSYTRQLCSAAMQTDRQWFTQKAIYQGNTVAVKPIDHEKITLTRTVLVELKLMQQIHHENLTQFVGGIIEQKNNFIITEYCSKGSLQDVLQNDSIKLDWMFRLSLLRDIARGMTFLHESPIKVHGRLRSTNCLVDRKFVLKLTGFGLPTLRTSLSSEEKSLRHAQYEKLLWVAPEILRSLDPISTQKGDVYSFGIILEETIHRSLPYDQSRAELGPQEIVRLVMSHQDPPFRPSLDTFQGSIPVGVYSLMYRCWSETPESRPGFSTIGKTVNKLQGNKEVNLVEALIHRLEEYSSNLEETVEERTQQLFSEKKKSEALLYQILPVSVADQLKQRKHVVPEMFECVTVYFSDIVGFTVMSSESSPVEVVEFLNDLYTLFDSVVENFDVYKVETIGDAYMCVSGLPIRNENHAAEICRMALALLRGVRHFSIKHRPLDQLRVRIGVHSGPCAAGVIGQKMPRYCLFGDTVNTSSRIESTGEALKIHISMSTKLLLDKVRTFVTELRGKVEMKGKGEQVTYWLIGEREGVRNQLDNK